MWSLCVLLSSLGRPGNEPESGGLGMRLGMRPGNEPGNEDGSGGPRNEAMYR